MQIETIKLYLNTNSSELLKTGITYDETHHNKIKTITLKNSSQYLFEYDEYDRIEIIKLNDILLVTYTYDKFNNILTTPLLTLKSIYLFQSIFQINFIIIFNLTSKLILWCIHIGIIHISSHLIIKCI